jgi:CDP-glucose 4,6-dehydratase
VLSSAKSLSGVWADRSVFVTGHTGFKGAWLTLYLQSLGARVTGLSIDVRDRSLFRLASLEKDLVEDHRADVLDMEVLRRAISEAQPSVVFHLAAQPLVRDSFARPVETIATNVLGSANTVQACNEIGSVGALVVVTTDKVYENEDPDTPCVESDRLGGKDPYSASKAAAELVVASLRSSVIRGSLAVATTRAGNVLGGGDDSQNRVVPDLVRAFREGASCAIRHPHAVRPWQHVLDPLRGYIMLAERLLARQCEDAWNFGPEPDAQLSVADVATLAASSWGYGARWHDAGAPDDRESAALRLDSAKARDLLNWSCLLSQRAAVEWAIRWERAVAAGDDPADTSLQQLEDFLVLAR